MKKTKNPEIMQQKYPEQRFELGKPIQTALVGETNSWLLFYEFPDGSLSIEGIRPDPMSEREFFTQRIRFSKEAIEKIYDFLTWYLHEKNL